MTPGDVCTQAGDIFVQDRTGPSIVQTGNVLVNPQQAEYAYQFGWSFRKNFAESVIEIERTPKAREPFSPFIRLF